MVRSRNIRHEETSNFLGILEGKRKARLLAEKAEQERKTLELKASLAAQSGYKTEEVVKQETDQLKTQTAAAIAAGEAQTNTKLYLVIGVIVVAVMVGLYFIFKKK